MPKVGPGDPGLLYTKHFHATTYTYMPKWLDMPRYKTLLHLVLCIGTLHKLYIHMYVQYSMYILYSTYLVPFGYLRGMRGGLCTGVDFSGTRTKTSRYG